MERYFEKFYKKITIISALVCIVFFCLSAIEENFLSEWKSYQQEFKNILMSKAETDQAKAVAKNFPIKIKQLILEKLDRVDRCVSCHNGIENPNMADQVVPHKNHSGSYIKNHPIEKFGCTICHGGQGRALSRSQAFARDKGLHWEYPILPIKFTQSSCGHCHLSVFDKDQKLQGAEILMKGRDLFLENGCISCHSIRGTGGSIGVELTRQGEKTGIEYSFLSVEGERSVQNWLREHFVNPQQVSENSQMLAVELNDEDMNALITCTMGLCYPEYSSDFYSLEVIKEFKGFRKTFSGEQSYELFCAICHGIDGEGKDYRVFEESVPALNNQQFLAMASDDMIKFTIQKGRQGRIMSPWASVYSGLTGDELDGLVKYIRGWQKQPPKYQAVFASSGKVSLGSTMFRSRCGTCHGLDGEGGIGPALNNQDFLALASDQFLYKTLVDGRDNTGMPSWSDLSKIEIASIIAFLRNWQKTAQIALPGDKISGDIDSGRLMFQLMCVGCHGLQGQGAVGPAILNKNFLNAASDFFLLNSITNGRRNTAMISWGKQLQGLEQLTESEIKDIVVYMRSMENKPLEVLTSNIISGTPTVGKLLYAGMCSGCHGKNGEGKHGPALNNQQFLNAATNGFIQGTIALGRSGTAMRSWAKGAQGYEELTEVEINDIVSYIRTWQNQIIKIEE